MDEIFGLMFHISYVHTPQKIFLKFLTVGHLLVIFVTEFVILVQNPHFYEVNKRVWKWLPTWRNFKNIFCVICAYHKWNFGPKKLFIFHFQLVNNAWFSHVVYVKVPMDSLLNSCKRTLLLLAEVLKVRNSQK